MDLQPVKRWWEGPVVSDYMAGRIVNERTLQAALYGVLREGLPDLEIYIEPGLCYRESGGPRFRPDLMVCDAAEVRLIAEIKFLPHWYPAVSKDLRTLADLDAGRADGHELRIDPQTGQFAGHRHATTDATVFALFVVGRADARDIDADIVRRHRYGRPIADRLSIFYGRVSPGSDPEFGSDIRT